MNNMGEIVHLLETGCHAWRCGNDQEGVSNFQRACLEWLEHMDQAEGSTEEEWSTISTLVSLLDNVMDLLRSQDIVVATDVLEWRVIPFLRSCE
ncbi:MAG: hypothetical protein A2201_06530 [Alicyclobacillus sp. RIFOXYA1_FULL_53_8]|nr:MAG: hypothetical protein A2201_06530 [Alicyclobacillus sp. RIFOXYA1_FULL_53_8]